MPEVLSRDRSLPLSGIRIAELGDDVGARMTTRVLAALGADVFAVRSASAHTSVPLLPDRRSALDLFLDDGKTVVSDAVAADASAADIVVWGGIELPAAIAALTAHGVIVAQVSPWGEVGPDAALVYDDLLLQARAGIVSLIGKSDRHPLALGGHQAAYSAGLQAATGILIALHHRDRTGEGQRVTVSHLEAASALEWKGPVYAQADGSVLRRDNAGGPTVVPVSDGHVAFYYRPADWPQVLELLNRPALRDERFATPAGRAAHKGELARELGLAGATWTKDALYSAAQSRDIPVGVVSTVDDLLASPQYEALHALEPSAAGSASRQPTLPFTFDGERFGVRTLEGAQS